MLILIRRIGEAIYIDKGRIKVHLLSENDGLIRLGIEAPKHFDIERKEVFVRKAVAQHEQAQALRNQSGGDDA
ncbi:carbon storage regulator [Legionella bononiensis]|uniref:Translational regulator CsrA n=1 Tax=Legionella bononiensis TaxID=2793102 RepID=A0ABS1W8Q4_9GAMM|nr:carbon storage regulator [Legionella bononiensis]MBL7479744.1 carbon storage regulator [Legionella bononiensis]MBL7525743.1 carbon storage regulator [Legionella bononiensis]MBL7561925.1 carbon storage regulator [Legionella bononiensis]